MSEERWLANITRRVEELETWRRVQEGVSAERSSEKTERKWLFNVSILVVNTVLTLVNFWMSHK